MTFLLINTLRKLNGRSVSQADIISLSKLRNCCYPVLLKGDAGKHPAWPKAATDEGFGALKIIFGFSYSIYTFTTLINEKLTKSEYPHGT